jgi:hypothetical protein
MIVDIDGHLIRVEFDQPEYSPFHSLRNLALWSEKSLASMPVPEVAEVCKATSKVREILEEKGFRVIRVLGTVILPGE